MNTRQRGLSVSIKLIATVAAVALVVIGVQTWLNLESARQRDEAEARQHLVTLYNGYVDRVEALKQTAGSMSVSLADRADIQELYLARDRAGLLALLKPLFSILKTDYKVAIFSIHAPDGTVFVRLHEPARFGDNVAYRRTVATAIQSRRTEAGLEIGPARLGIRSVSPMYHNGDIAGLVEVGLNYDQTFIQGLQAATEANYKIWITRGAADQAGLAPAQGAPTPPIPELVYYASSKPDALPIPREVYARVLQSGQLETLLVSNYLTPTAALVAPLLGYQNQTLGVLEISISRAQAAADLQQSQVTIWGIAGGLTLLALALIWAATYRVVLRPLGRLTSAARRQLAGDMAARVQLRARDEFGQLGDTLNTLTENLDNTLKGLEQRVAERTRDAERRSAYLEASAQVSRAASSILEPDELIRQVVDLIRDHFDLYYVGLFLVDEAGEWAVLKAGTGRAGQAMLSRGHRIKIGAGMVGWSIAHAQARVALEAGDDAARLATAELPDTRSEAAIPLRSRGQVMGALTVQSSQPGAFDEIAIAALQTMADQVATALANARLFAESQAALEAARRAYGEFTRQAWEQLLRTRPSWGYRYIPAARNPVTPAEGDWPPELALAAQAGQSVRGNGGQGHTIAVPLKVRGQAVGALRFDKGSATWTPQEIALLETLVGQMGLALESASMYQDTQRRAAREQLVGEITAHMRQTLDLETVLKTALDEMYAALGLEEVAIHLETNQGGAAGQVRSQGGKRP